MNSLVFGSHGGVVGGTSKDRGHFGYTEFTANQSPEALSGEEREPAHTTWRVIIRGQLQPCTVYKEVKSSIPLSVPRPFSLPRIDCQNRRTLPCIFHACSLCAFFTPSPILLLRLLDEINNRRSSVWSIQLYYIYPELRI